MTWIVLFVLSLAVARIVRLLVYESGPWNAFGSLRGLLGANDRLVKPGGLAELFNCPWCIGLWVTLALWTWFCFDQQSAMAVSLVLAISFLAGALVVVTSR